MPSTLIKLTLRVTHSLPMGPILKGFIFSNRITGYTNPEALYQSRAHEPLRGTFSNDSN